MTNENTLSELQNTGVRTGSPPRVRKRLHRWTRSLIRVGLLSYAGILVLMVLMEPKLVYPGAYGVTTVDFSDAGRADSQSVPWEYPAPDGSTIVGRLLDRSGSVRTILFLHGNGRKAEMMDETIAHLSRCFNANVLAAEYRGFQDPNTTTPHESNVVADALAAHDALCRRYKLAASDLVVYGYSLGGGCAAAIAKEHKTKTLILDRTFDSAADVAAARFPAFPVRWLMRNQFDSVRRLQDFSGRLIQIHGSHDAVVPIAHGKRLHQAIPTREKVFLEVPGMRHNDPLPAEMLKTIQGLLDQARSRSSPVSTVTAPSRSD